MLLREIMTVAPQTLPPEATVFDALSTMAELEVRHIPVVDDGALVGVISDRDLRTYARAALAEATGTRERLRVPLSEVMSADVLALEEEEEVDAAIELFLDQKVGAIPIVDPEGNLKGIVSVLDVLRVAQGRL